MDLIILFITVLINSALAFLVYKNNPKSVTNIIFGLLSFSIIGWLITVYLSLLPELISSSLFWIRLGLVFAVPFTTLFLLLAYTFPDIKLGFSKKVIYILGIISSVLMINNISPFAFTRLDIVNNSPNPVPGPGLAPFVIFVVSSYGTALYFLIKRFKSSVGLEKEQLRFFMTGLLVMLGLIIVTIMIPVVFFRSSYFLVFAPLYTLVFLGSTAYAIIRHKLFDIRLVVARAAAYAILATFLFILYVSAATFLASVFTNTTATLSQLLLFGIMALIVGYTFNPIRSILEKFTDKIFYRAGYDSSELLSALTKIMATTLGLNSLMERLLVKMLPEMRISKGAFVLVEKGKMDGHKAIGFGKKVEFVGTDIISLLEENKILLVDEVEKKKIKKTMQDLDTTVCVPLKVGDDELGILLLGHKLSGEIYSDQDIKVLQILSPEISIAIQNAKAYEEIRKFNITLQREIEKATAELRNANEKLKDLDKLKDEFMSIASHELRTPMTAIKSYVWLSLHGKIAEKDPKVRDYLNKVYDSSERMIAMINDMLNVSRIETGRIQLEIVPVSVYKVADQVKDDLTARADEAGVKVVINKETVVPNVLADRDKLIEIFTNLVGNSLKFTKKGGEIAVAAKKTGNMVEVSVADTGVGISKENLPKLFKKYGKLGESYATVSPTTGTGLGLYITKQYLEKMDGYIKVDSVLGKGTTFTFALPMATGKELAHIEEDEDKPIGIVFNPEFLKQSKEAQKIAEQQKH